MSGAVVVVGVGPGLGASVARRFAREGYAVGLVARRAEVLAPVEREINAAGGRATCAPCDATDAASITAGFAKLREAHGPCDVLVYNASAFQFGGVMDITPAQLEDTWRVSCLGGLLAAQRVIPDMLAKKRGTILFTGATASLRGAARFACFAVGKFGLRALAQSMARELQPQGIHVAHVVVDGGIDSPRARAGGAAPEALLAPDAIAETYWQLHAQPPTTWTHELDLRPSLEKF